MKYTYTLDILPSGRVMNTHLCFKNFKIQRILNERIRSQYMKLLSHLNMISAYINNTNCFNNQPDSKYERLISTALPQREYICFNMYKSDTGRQTATWLHPKAC